jgi:hypothetical protein
LALIHWFAIQGGRRRFGWFYLPLGLFGIIVIVALSGGIPSR